ncbi:peroxiredoxin [Haloferula luteola]|uniref:Peroxiredoxin n=1 Tax=Haloferula luteola TaxID=595692 RepID=A0A840VAA5_9BACT|nr:thioredoxin family protein [Haloferula luteola]MBB5349841.1 peroxiredoxin [Haloferula luteola]
MAETPSTFLLKSGEPAPCFALPDATGREHRLDEVSGPRGTLVVFVCNHCPYVVMLASALGSLADEWKTRGIGVVAITSNDVENYPQDGPEYMGDFASKHGWNFPYLYDATQEVAHAYGAACTPDFFLFDGEGALFYAGQFDDSRPKNEIPPSGNDLSAAVDALLSGAEPPSPARPSTGCNIKWKKGMEPESFG